MGARRAHRATAWLEPCAVRAIRIRSGGPKNGRFIFNEIPILRIKAVPRQIELCAHIPNNLVFNALKFALATITLRLDLVGIIVVDCCHGVTNNDFLLLVCRTCICPPH
jgi:hypothetical protein